MSLMEDEQLENNTNVPKQLQPHVYKKGQSGNPNGRPKGSISLKQYAKKMLEQMTPEEREEYLSGLDKKFIWEMAEGKAENKTDVTSNGQTVYLGMPPEVIERTEDEVTPETE